MAGETCPTCGGKGYITCVYCKGTGDTAGSRYGKGKVKCPAYCRDGYTAPRK
jgi:DnaJ-class molecular chaperone